MLFTVHKWEQMIFRVHDVEQMIFTVHGQEQTILLFAHFQELIRNDWEMT